MNVMYQLKLGITKVKSSKIYQKDVDVSVISLKNINCFLGDGEFEGKNSLKN